MTTQWYHTNQTIRARMSQLPWYLFSPLAGIAERSIKFDEDQWDDLQIDRVDTVATADNLIKMFRTEKFNISPIQKFTDDFCNLEPDQQQTIVDMYGVTEWPPANLTAIDRMIHALVFVSYETSWNAGYRR